MTKPKPTSIGPPPSLDDVVSAAGQERLGRVDFTTRLVSLGDVADVAGPQTPEPVEEAPVVVGSQPEPEPAPVLVGPMISRASTVAAERLAAPPADGPDEEPAEQRRAAFEAAVTTRVRDLTQPPHPPARPAGDAAPDLAPPEPPVTLIGAPDEGLHHLGLTVDDVARSVIARMREAGEANRRHLEALELEAARRLELLTAQAELDAELIRLHARREAHAIVTAARLRSGSRSGIPEESRRLHDIDETFSRFTESVAAVDADRDDPDDQWLT